ncbi:TspO/MBR family protein [Pelagibacterium xiamenense]|uniref:TspO/MBR family protein n=1 Tax=Pelagibacterium xiamenense TaxID=2901140 RepID=UPI001E4D22A6|nr:TspO/MBR family protein [Pelagibacterium xiamenense]MCD7059922.1 tryptophan-rich sensory protein [Pelagibacterium xiamenense]
MSIFVLLAFLGACFLAAATGAFFRPGTWYETLVKPDWRPPNWLFGPVWTVLYIAMAVSGWLVWREAGFSGATGALFVYAVQLLLNGSWSVLFFGLHRPDLALAEIVLLWLAIMLTIVLFWPISMVAALLMVPYALWVGFASVLNFAIWRLNPVH